MEIEFESALSTIRRRAMAGFMPPPSLSICEWVEKTVHLPDTGALPGRMRLHKWQRGVLEAAVNPETEILTLQKAARCGFTALLTSLVAHFVANAPTSIIAVQPTEADARDYVVSDVEPTFEASPELRGLLTVENDESGRSTLLSRRFPGGSLKVLAAKSPRNARRHTARVVIIDEADAPDPAPEEGDFISLFMRRNFTFSNGLTIIGGTPLILETSRVLRFYELSDRRQFHIPCARCGKFFELLWRHLKWLDGKPESVIAECPHCAGSIQPREKAGCVEDGDWIAQARDIKHRPGFRLNALVSTVAQAAWSRLVAEFLDVKDDPTRLQPFVNLTWGEGWRDAVETLNENELAGRVEGFSLKALPEGVLFITVGVDCQDDRLELVFMGHGRDNELWILGNQVIWGRPQEEGPWQELDAVIRTVWTHPKGGIINGADAVAIDGSDGDHWPHVLAFAASRLSRKVIAIKGASGWSRPPLQPSKTHDHKRFWVVGVDSLKRALQTRFGAGRGVHFSETLEPRYFEEVASEYIATRYVRGVPSRQWVRKKGMRAELLDSSVYGLAAKTLIGMPIDRRETELASSRIPERPPSVIYSKWLNKI